MSATPQGPLCVWHGATLGVWVRLLAGKPPLGWNRSLRIASITAASLVNSALNLAESMIHGRRIGRQRLDHPPIFILGHWRSGTTLLHNLMALDPALTYPNLFQVMNPGRFLLTERVVPRLTAWMVPKTRPMDSMPASWSMPQEDELALLVSTLLSPYLMLAHSGNRPAYGKYFDLTDLTPEERRRWMDALLRFMKKLTLRNDAPIVLKSPAHTFRIPTLLEMFPKARFIYLYREPYAVFSSTMNLRRTLCAGNHLGRPNFHGLEDDVLRTYMDCFHTYQRTKHLIPADRLHELRFEDLEADPVRQTELIYERLGLSSWRRLEPALRRQIPILRGFRKNTFSIPDDLRHRIYATWRPAFEQYGYPSTPAVPDRSSRSTPGFRLSGSLPA